MCLLSAGELYRVATNLEKLTPGRNLDKEISYTRWSIANVTKYFPCVAHIREYNGRIFFFFLSPFVKHALLGSNRAIWRAWIFSRISVERNRNGSRARELYWICEVLYVFIDIPASQQCAYHRAMIASASASAIRLRVVGRAMRFRNFVKFARLNPRRTATDVASFNRNVAFRSRYLRGALPWNRQIVFSRDYFSGASR